MFPFFFLFNEEYLFVRLISHLGGSSIATVIVLEESPGPILLFVSIAMYFFSVITFHGLPW